MVLLNFSVYYTKLTFRGFQCDNASGPCQYGCISIYCIDGYQSSGGEDYQTVELSDWKQLSVISVEVNINFYFIKPRALARGFFIFYTVRGSPRWIATASQKCLFLLQNCNTGSIVKLYRKMPQSANIPCIVLQCIALHFFPIALYCHILTLLLGN